MKIFVTKKYENYCGYTGEIKRVEFCRKNPEDLFVVDSPNWLLLTFRYGLFAVEKFMIMSGWSKYMDLPTALDYFGFDLQKSEEPNFLEKLMAAFPDAEVVQID